MFKLIEMQNILDFHIWQNSAKITNLTEKPGTYDKVDSVDIVLTNETYTVISNCSHI
jgi:hypothetical protein